MSDALKFFAYLFLVSGIISGGYHLYTGYQLTHDEMYMMNLRSLYSDDTKKIDDPQTQAQIRQIYREPMRIAEGASKIKNYIGIASVFSGLLSFLMFYSQSTILKRTELLEELYKQNRQERMLE